MFEAMIRGIREETVRRLFVVRIRKEEKLERKSVSKNAAANVGGDGAAEEAAGEEDKEARPQRPLPLRQAQAQRPAHEIQGLLRPQRVSGGGRETPCPALQSEKRAAWST